MHFHTLLLVLLTTLTSPLVSALPPRRVKSMMATQAPNWTIGGFTRTCNSGDTSCTFQYSINANDGTPVGQCSYTSYNIGSTPASRAHYYSQDCGSFAVSSGWSGQFGEGRGFTTLSVYGGFFGDGEGGYVVYPSYTDVQLVNGQAVTPDQSYAPQVLG